MARQCGCNSTKTTEMAKLEQAPVRATDAEDGCGCGCDGACGCGGALSADEREAGRAGEGQTAITAS